jgi:hypothetical protein
MAIVRVYFHRNTARLGPHLRYIATREGACGLQGLGPQFRALRGDVDACVRLFHDHAARARRGSGPEAREGAFARLLFTLPPETAARVSAADARVPEGSRLVLRDAIEATFRSVGRGLQGVYAIHFHAARREAHGHVHVDLSPLDVHGRPTFVTDEQRERFRTTWAREVAKALERIERRPPTPARDAAAAAPDPVARRDESTRTRASETAAPRTEAARTLPIRPLRTSTDPRTWTDARARRRARTASRTPSTMRFLASRLLAAAHSPRAPLLDLLVRAVTRTGDRRPRAPLTVRFALGFPVPHILVRAHTPFTTRTLRLPFTS